MRNYKKYLAATLAAAMVLGNSVVAFAATPSTPSSPSDVVLTGTPSEGETITGTITGNAGIEGNVATDVFSVVVPAFALDPSDIPADVKNERDGMRGVFDFILDPQKLITLTDGAKYATMSTPASGSTPSEVKLNYEKDATMFFELNDGSFSSKSEEITVTNRSTMDVIITLEATFDSTDGIAVVTDKTFKNISTPSEPSVYMALVTGNTETPVDPETNTATVKSTIAKAPSGAYDVEVDESNNYVYKLANEDANFETYTYQLTGASNPNADWSNTTIAGSGSTKIDVVWTVKVPENLAPSIATKTFTLAQDTAVLVPINLGEGDKAATGIRRITYKNSSDQDTELSADNYSITDGQLRFKGSFVNSLVSSKTTRVYTVVFNDEARTSIDITLRAPAS